MGLPFLWRPKVHTNTTIMCHKCNCQALVHSPDNDGLKYSESTPRYEQPDHYGTENGCATFCRQCLNIYSVVRARRKKAKRCWVPSSISRYTWPYRSGWGEQYIYSDLDEISLQAPRRRMLPNDAKEPFTIVSVVTTQPSCQWRLPGLSRSQSPIPHGSYQHRRYRRFRSRFKVRLL